MLYRPRRSVLYMPGSNTRALEKAKELNADSLIFDLEDSVSPDLKLHARHQVCDAIDTGDYSHQEIIVRVNALTTEWGVDDFRAVADTQTNAILIPKISRSGHVIEISDTLDKLDAHENLKIWVMMETPLAVLNAKEIAATTRSVDRFECFVMGLNDLAKETGVQISRDRSLMMPWLSQCVLAARAYGLTILDSVYNDYGDTRGFKEECLQGYRLGLDGKTLIHPNQINIANEAFSPSSDEVEWLKKIVSFYEKPENKEKGAISIDGEMVERLHADIAYQKLEIVKKIEQIEKK